VRQVSSNLPLKARGEFVPILSDVASFALLAKVKTDVPGPID